MPCTTVPVVPGRPPQVNLIWHPDGGYREFDDGQLLAFRNYHSAKRFLASREDASGFTIVTLCCQATRPDLAQAHREQERQRETLAERFVLSTAVGFIVGAVLSSVMLLAHLFIQ